MMLAIALTLAIILHFRHPPQFVAPPAVRTAQAQPTLATVTPPVRFRTPIRRSAPNHSHRAIPQFGDAGYGIQELFGDRKAA